MIGVKLTASDFELELYVDSYEFPDFHTGRDANALTCELELDLKRQRLDLHTAHSLILYTFELTDFVDQLRALQHAPDGQATLGDPDQDSGDEFGLTITLNGAHGTLDGFLAESTTTRLTFEMINIDRSFVRDTLTKLAAILAVFLRNSRDRRHRRCVHAPSTTSTRLRGNVGSCAENSLEQQFRMCRAGSISGRLLAGSWSYRSAATGAHVCAETGLGSVRVQGSRPAASGRPSKYGRIQWPPPHIRFGSLGTHSGRRQPWVLHAHVEGAWGILPLQLRERDVVEPAERSALTDVVRPAWCRARSPRVPPSRVDANGNSSELTHSDPGPSTGPGRLPDLNGSHPHALERLSLVVFVLSETTL